ncbi:MAG: hypothetical protein ACRERD_26250 [Candidatus Binatia bacterium]
MTTARSTTSRRGTWLVIGLLALATILVIISRVYRTPPPPQDLQETTQQPDFAGARQGIELAREGVNLLPVEEQRELDALYTAALQALSPEEKQRFFSLAQKGAGANDQEIVESTQLIQQALNSLPPDKNARLWTLVDKAVQLQRAQGGAEAPAKDTVK